MAIKKFYSNKAKAGWRWDEKTKKFSSWGYDVRFEDGSRKRENGFASKQLAENAVSRIRISEKEGKYDLTRREFPLVLEVCEKRLKRIESKKERTRAVTILNRWLAMLPPNLKINELAQSHIRLYINERITEVKAVSVNREITVIGSALHSAYVDFPELETWTCPRIPRPKVENKPFRFSKTSLSEKRKKKKFRRSDKRKRQAKKLALDFVWTRFQFTFP